MFVHDTHCQMAPRPPANEPSWRDAPRKSPFGGAIPNFWSAPRRSKLVGITFGRRTCFSRVPVKELKNK